MKQKNKVKPKERCLNEHTRSQCSRGCEELNQADCSSFAPMGDPQKCPECGKEISSLGILKEQIVYNVYLLEQGALDELSYRSKHEVDVFERAVCSKCQKTLPFDSIEEAKEFLKTGKLPK